MRLAIALALSLAAAPALAAPAPDVTIIQPGPRVLNGRVLQPPFSDWINFRVDAVEAKGSDLCALHGTVAAVYRGLHYRRGESAVIDAPCGSVRLSPLRQSLFGDFWLDRDWLWSVKEAAIQLDDDGHVVSFAATRGLTRIY